MIVPWAEGLPHSPNTCLKAIRGTWSGLLPGSLNGQPKNGPNQKLGLSPMSAQERRDLLEVVEDSHTLASTIVAAQLPIQEWHANIRDPTIADAILDRLVHNAYKITLKGQSMRKLKSNLTNQNKS
ncbi:MAG: ATP-binding protein [Deltaproteobacteria bacterium]|nr:ATP-binding protein [Deltaproteobacteria bacterium]